MRQLIVVILLFILVPSLMAQNNSTIKEYDREFKTYPYSDPDPIPTFELIYPYYRFDGYTNQSINKDWKVVELENEYIKVMILPEIGGKIWTAIEKSSEKPFIYFNQVVKFRDIAMRGAWTSGGIEANYGIIGHTPNCSTPVDYWNEEKSDGSVSCYIGTLDLLTQTYWTLEINLPKDKAYFTTRSFWHNGSSLEQPYYTWMNAGIKAKGNLQFIYPGNKYIGHDGEYADWPINASNGKDISYYENNNFGQYKSYHVFGQYTDFFGGYWHDEDFGMGRYAHHADKPGKKIWIWGLSQQGMIWEKLLTDTDGQYVEVQSGRLYNQTAEQSTFTPFKHRGFAPYATDEWIEYWFPVKGTNGFVQANPHGSLNVLEKNGKMTLAFSPLQNFSDEVKVARGEEVLYNKKINFKVLEPFETSFNISGDTEDMVVRVGDKVEYRLNADYATLSRPIDAPEDFDWSSSYGLWLQGKEFVRSRNYKMAALKLQEALVKNPNYLPALTDMALIMNVRGLYEQAFDYSLHALRIDTYDPAANYYYGLASKKLNKWVDAKDGFDIASQGIAFRGPAFTELSKLYLKEKIYKRATESALEAITEDKNNVTAYQLLAIAQRKTNQIKKAEETLSKINSLNPLNHFVRLEYYLLDKSETTKNRFTSMIRNEMPWETYLQLGIEYFELNLFEEAIEVLSLSPSNPQINYWIAFINFKSNSTDYRDYIERANEQSAELVFPFREETIKVLNWCITQTDHWKPKYYLGLLYRHTNQLDEATKIFQLYDETPDYAPFYVARADLMTVNREVDLKRAAQLDPNQWRYGKLLINYYLDQGNSKLAVLTAKEYTKRIPNNYMISMLLAKALLYDGQFEAASQILSKTNILPYEGATESRALYRESWLMQAVSAIKNKNYKNALSMIQQARLWPQNLGVGKPYDADIDDRLEDYLESICHEGMRNSKLAEAKWMKIAEMDSRDGFGKFIAAMVYKKSNRQTEGRALLANWIKADPSNKLANWSMNAFSGNVDYNFNYDNSDFRIMKALLNSN